MWVRSLVSLGKGCVICSMIGLIGSWIDVLYSEGSKGMLNWGVLVI